MMDSISDERCEAGLRYLAETDRTAAELKVDSQRLEDEIKATKAAIVQRVDGSVELRKAIAETHENTMRARNDYYAALLKHEHMANRRRTEERITDLWRSVNANRRQGQ